MSFPDQPLRAGCRRLVPGECAVRAFLAPAETTAHPASA
jgi:hypothetical protein